jgi:acetyl esterase/lipase
LHKLAKNLSAQNAAKRRRKSARLCYGLLTRTNLKVAQHALTTLIPSLRQNAEGLYTTALRIYAHLGQRTVTKALLIALLFAYGSAALIAQTPDWQPSPGHKQTPIWPGTPPDAVPEAGPEYTKTVGEVPPGAVVVGKVSRPTMTVYSPMGKNTGAAVVVFPGGGYWVLYMDLEGSEVCDWLTSKGVTCVLSKYRVPGEHLSPRSGAYPKSPVALEDAQRTLGLVRFHAAEWGIDPHKIGVLGFSAGGHLVAAVSTNFKRRLYKAVDAADRRSCRPDFGVALYPGHMLENTSREFELNPYVPVTKETPPMFLLQAEDDPIDTVRNRWSTTMR